MGGRGAVRGSAIHDRCGRAGRRRDSRPSPRLGRCRCARCRHGFDRLRRPGPRRCRVTPPVPLAARRSNGDQRGPGADLGGSHRHHDVPVTGVPHHGEHRQRPLPDGCHRSARHRPATRHPDERDRPLGRGEPGTRFGDRRHRLPARTAGICGHPRDARLRRRGRTRERGRLRVGTSAASVHHHVGDVEHRPGSRASNWPVGSRNEACRR